ncbi:F420-0--gamma-glutamyl ligase [Streptococcus criceti]|uniref:Nitroreductase domain-containing protein n=1 Tax=Streptococcus criceti HS-6 TaxID=873449 RepID=G5JRE6_STRCG|nr:nitroreductase family protein [Streptococcus criceti]EHI75145.1 hypothetical protein STRCR_0733 [Streptococcus criceti HS-6]SUN43733.1 F420-0--gamma-glutamyl ligase [Streptococcus criceti]
MEFYDVINKRRTIRQFKDEPIEKVVIERILEAGLKAPSSNHQRRWELVTLTDKTLISEVASFVKPYRMDLKEAKTPRQEMAMISYPKQRTQLSEAACLILPFFPVKYEIKSPKNDYGLWDYGATWTLIENIFLATTAEGLGANLHAPVGKESQLIKDYLGVPERYYLPAVLALGHPIDQAELPTQVNATLKNRVHWNKWKRSKK